METEGASNNLKTFEKSIWNN